jgi:hypothetical protein
MDRKRNSEKQEPQQHPIEPEMQKRPGEDQAGREPATEPPKEKRGEDL